MAPQEVERVRVLQDQGGGSHAHPDTMWANELKACVLEEKKIVYGYDDNGNQTSRTEDGLVESFVYDYANRVVCFARND